MTEFLDWKYIDVSGVNALEATTDENDIKRLLSEIFNISSQKKTKQGILVDYHFYNYAFCKQSAFNSRQTSTLLSIMTDLLSYDMRASTVTHNMQLSFQRFQDIVIKHSIERPPKSVQIFESVDVERIVDYVLSSYYRNYSLYMYVFGVQTIVTVKQQAVGGVELPHVNLPLQMGMLVVPKQEEEGEGAQQ